MAHPITQSRTTTRGCLGLRYGGAGQKRRPTLTPHRRSADPRKTTRQPAQQHARVTTSADVRPAQAAMCQLMRWNTNAELRCRTEPNADVLRFACTIKAVFAQ
jgi:hypothetical protein